MAKDVMVNNGTIIGNKAIDKKNRKRNKEYRYISIDKA